jgi:hypothetical protein
MGLLDLPVETLSQICMQFCQHCSYHNFLPGGAQELYEGGPIAGVKLLLSLSRTCRALRAVAQPIAYHDITSTSTFHLLRTLSESPHLAAQVRGLHFGDTDRASLDPDGVAAVEAVATRLGINLPPDWAVESWEHGDNVPYRMVELILGLLSPNLEALKYTTFMEGQLGDLLKLSPQAGGGARCAVAFPCLRRLWLGHWDTEGGMLLGGEGLAALLSAAPKLEALTLYMCGGVEVGLPLQNLRKLKITWSYLEADDLANAVAACPNLESFEYSSSGNTDGAGGDEFLPADAWEALRARAPTLRHLELDLGNYLEIFNEDLEPDQRMGSLVEFRRLERLRVAPSFFTRAGVRDDEGFHNSARLIEMLPQSVRVLSLPARYWGGTYDKYEDPIRLVRAKRHGQFPNLIAIEVAVHESDMERVSAAFAEVGVKCKQYGSEDNPPYLAPTYPFREAVKWPGY